MTKLDIYIFLADFNFLRNLIFLSHFAYSFISLTVVLKKVRINRNKLNMSNKSVYPLTSRWTWIQYIIYI